MSGLGEAVFVFVVFLVGAALVYFGALGVAVVTLARRIVGRAPWDAWPLAASAVALAMNAFIARLAGMHDVLEAARGATIVVPFVVLALSAAGLAGAARPRLRAVGYACALVASAALAAFLVRVTRPDETMTSGAITSVAGTFAKACATFDDGRVACGGTGAFGGGENPDGIVRVDGIDDATRVVAASYTACVLRRRGDVACVGDTPPPAILRSRHEAWRVPDSDGAVDVVLAHEQVLGRRANGSTFGWPDPAPREWTNVIALGGASGNESDTFCAILASGGVSCAHWTQQKLDGVRSLPGIGGATGVGATPDGAACAIVAGKLSCFDEHDKPRVVPEWDDVLDVFGVPNSANDYCARRRAGDVICWSFYTTPPYVRHDVMHTTAAIMPGYYLCSRSTSAFECVDAGGRHDTTTLAALLALGK